MRFLDLIKEDQKEVLQKLKEAVQNNDTEAFAEAFSEYASVLQESIIKEAKEIVNTHDANILAQRGVRQLTTRENDYYQKVIDAMRSSNPKQALTELEVVLPETVIESIFTYLRANHPLLELVDFRDTEVLVQFIKSTTSGNAVWGELTDDIKGELSGSFVTIDLAQKKLTAFLPIAKAMLDLGPQWIDRYIRELLAEAIAAEAEKEIVDGDGKSGPIGMTRKLTGAVDGVHQRKSAITVDSLDPKTYGTILNTISKAPNDKRRPVPELLMVVNPADYYTKVFPATTIRQANGTYANNVFPYPTKVVVSDAVPANHAVFGLAKRYFFGLGTSKGGRIEYSDDYKFIEDQRIYAIRLYGNGRALDENAFVYADITNLKATVQEVYVTNAEDFPSA